LFVGTAHGLIYKATPPSTVCTNALCSWNETTIYEFTSGTDAFGVTAFDSAGNLYGIGSGGAYGQGAVFELTPLSGGWTEQILYSFTGGADGGGPNSLLLGQDGNLYGTAAGGGNNGCYYGVSCGVVFQLVPSGSGWTENVIYAFTGAYTDGWDPSGLIQDSQGNLYGVDVCFGFLYGGCYPYEYFRLDGVIFGLSRSGGGWEFGQIHTYETSECPLDSRGDNVNAGVTYHALTLDPGGILYATEGGGTIYFCGQNCYIEVSCGGIWSRRSGTVVSGAADIFGNITSDANGNLYGTTSTCGFGTLQRTDGMIWQYSP
jgi:hypothetical protein